KTEASICTHVTHPPLCKAWGLVQSWCLVARVSGHFSSPGLLPTEMDWAWQVRMSLLKVLVNAGDGFLMLGHPGQPYDLVTDLCSQGGGERCRCKCPQTTAGGVVRLHCAR